MFVECALVYIMEVKQFFRFWHFTRFRTGLRMRELWQILRLWPSRIFSLSSKYCISKDASEFSANSRDMDINSYIRRRISVDLVTSVIFARSIDRH